MWWFIGGVFAGANLGVILMCLMRAGKQGDELQGLVTCERCGEPTRREMVVREGRAWVCERCAILEELRMTKEEKRREQLGSWTQEELIDAVMALEAEVEAWKVPYRALVCCRQGPHRVEFSVGFEGGELFQLVLQEAYDRRAGVQAGDEAMDSALAIHEYVHHYLCEATHEWTRALGHSLSGEVCRF